MKVKVIKAGLKSYWYADLIGKTFEVEPFKDESWGFKLVSDWFQGSYFAKDDVEIINEEKVMKREDKINLEMTLKEAARIYAVLGRTNGDIRTDLYSKLKEMFDRDGKAYEITVDSLNVVHYYTIQKEFEEAIFDQKSPAQIELEALQTKINELQTQAAKLQGLINK